VTSTLTEWLAARTEDELAAIIQRRPDALEPFPPDDLDALADRLHYPHSVRTVLMTMPVPGLQLIQTLLVFGAGGIEPAALAALAEHDFPGNEQELLGLLARAAATAQGPRITLPDLMRNGLGSQPAVQDEPDTAPVDPQPSPAPSLAMRRRSLRRAR